jgi:hypothetical protein
MQGLSQISLSPRVIPERISLPMGPFPGPASPPLARGAFFCIPESAPALASFSDLLQEGYFSNQCAALDSRTTSEGTCSLLATVEHAVVNSVQDTIQG